MSLLLVEMLAYLFHHLEIGEVDGKRGHSDIALVEPDDIHAGAVEIIFNRRTNPVIGATFGVEPFYQLFIDLAAAKGATFTPLILSAGSSGN